LIKKDSFNNILDYSGLISTIYSNNDKIFYNVKNEKLISQDFNDNNPIPFELRSHDIKSNKVLNIYEGHYSTDVFFLLKIFRVIIMFYILIVIMVVIIFLLVHIMIVLIFGIGNMVI
jgi:hypothetical protein